MSSGALPLPHGCPSPHTPTHHVSTTSLLSCSVLAFTGLCLSAHQLCDGGQLIQALRTLVSAAKCGCARPLQFKRCFINGGGRAVGWERPMNTVNVSGVVLGQWGGGREPKEVLGLASELLARFQTEGTTLVDEECGLHRGSPFALCLLLKQPVPTVSPPAPCSPQLQGPPLPSK